MKIWTTELTDILGNPAAEEYFTPSSVFFDIETTGFSPSSSQVYMIGYAAWEKGKPCITQLFSEHPAEEPKLLSAFLERISQYSTLISFNGTGFDVPFLAGRCSHYQIQETFGSFQHLDIYKQLSNYKAILNLPNLKQKTLESFLGVSREDKYSGGDLIPIYFGYVSHPSEETCTLLKLHNYEDMEGMLKLLPLLSYPHFFEGGFQVHSWEKHAWETYEGAEGWELILSLVPGLPLPKHISTTLGDASISGSQRRIKLRIPLYVGELKYFYPNYKDYYYLPAEDLAIHKSVASYVGKNYRAQATAATCYNRKNGVFLPQRQEVFSPSFKHAYHDRHSYFELAEPFTGSMENLKKYALHLLAP